MESGESTVSLTSGPDGRKRRVSYFDEPTVADYYYGFNNPTKPEQIRITHHLITSYHLHRRMEISRPNLAVASDFVKFHSPEYIDFLASVTPKTITDPSVSGNIERFNIDVDWDGLFHHSLFDYCGGYAGGSISAAVKLNEGDADIAINWAGGMHRAKKDRACGSGQVNDIVLGILELLKVFKRVLYIDIGFHHGDAVQEAFYDTDRVMTVSFHKCEEFPHPRTGELTDFGVGKGEYYSLNAPLKDGLKDADLRSLFMPVIHKVMEVYQPEAVVLQCGPDSLSGDRLGEFNLSTKGHADCLRYIRSFNIPLMVLGGEGYTLRNVVRCWCYETAVAVGVELHDNIPLNAYMDELAPGCYLHIRPNHMANSNTLGDIEEKKYTLLRQLSQVIHAPSVQFQDTPPISQLTEAAEEDMEMRQNPSILSGSPSYESDSDDDWCFLG